MAPHARQVETALDKLSEPVRIYARSWSLVRYGLLELTQAYRQWSQQQASNSDTTVALLYASAYGNTATLAQAIARGITKAGVGVESINCEVAEPAEIQAAVENQLALLSVHLHSVVMRPPRFKPPWALSYPPLPTTNLLGCLVPMAEWEKD